jgi:integrase
MFMRASALLSIPSSNLQHTIGHIDCQACEADRVAMSRTTDLKLLTFKDAAAVCLDDELKFSSLSPRTHEDHLAFVDMLNHFFGGLVLQNIHAGNILNYQKDRLAGRIGRAQGAGPDKINHEVSYLSHVLDKAGLWKTLKPHVNRLVVPKSKRGRALEPEEEKRLVICAASDPRWEVAYCGSMATINCGVGPSEIVHIRLQDVDMRGKVVRIRERVKNQYRERNVPFTATIQWLFSKLLKRYYKICERQGVDPHPDHYILPYLQTANRHNEMRLSAGTPSYDLTKPMSSWRSAWESLREKAGLPWLRRYDLRHHVATKWMEDKEISGDTVESMMGHGTAQMKRDYEHIRNAAKLAALQRHEVKPPRRIIETLEELIELPDVTEAKKPPESAPASARAHAVTKTV